MTIASLDPRSFHHRIVGRHSNRFLQSLPRKNIDRRYVDGLNLGCYLTKFGEPLRSDFLGARLIRAVERPIELHGKPGGLRVGNTPELR